MLVEHRVDDVDECLVAGEEAMSARQEVALEPSLTEVLVETSITRPSGESASSVELVVAAGSADIEDVVEPVGGRLVGPEETEVVLGFGSMTSRR